MPSLKNIACRVKLAFAVLAALCPLGGAHAQTVDATDRGSYLNTGEHDANSEEYLVGSGGGNEFRNWFLFAVPSVGAGQQYTGATLRLFNSKPVRPADFVLGVGYFSNDPSETYQVTDFSGSLSDLVSAHTAGDANGVSIFNDLGAGGADYGSYVASLADNGTFIEIPLSSAALADINAAAGSNFALGGYFSTLDADPSNAEFVFAVSGSSPSNTQLILTQGAVSAVNGPEPASLALLALGVTGAVVMRRNRGFARQKRIFAGRRVKT